MPLPLEGGSLTSFQELDRYGQYMQPPKSPEDTAEPSIEPQIMGQTVVGGNQLVGQVSTQPMMGGMPGNVIMVQQPSAAPKVIGIFSIIYGCFGVLGSLMIVILGSSFGSEIAGDVEESSLMILAVIGFLSGSAWIVAGVWINGRQRRGIHLAWLILVLEFIIDIVFASLIGGIQGVEGAIGMGASVVGTGICGVIIAIPLMVSNGGLDDSSLIPK